jgi:hypothetical protein
MLETKSRPAQGTWTGMILMTGAALLLMFAYYAFTWRSFAGFQAAIDTCGRPFCDFARYYYPMGETVIRTGAPVGGFVYSPFIAILLAGFPPLGLKAALILWGLLQVASILLYLVLFRSLVPTGQLAQLLFVFLASSSFPILHTLSWGQVGIFTVTAVLGALFFHERAQRLAAAVLLAFGLSFKFFPLIFIVPFVIRRDTRFLLLAAAMCGLFLLVVPGILLGVDGTMRFYTALIDSYRHFDWVITNYNSQHFPHVLLRLMYALGVNPRPYLPLFRWIGYAIAAINIGLLYLVQRGNLRHANLWSFHILFLSIPFVLKTSWPVDLVYLPFGQALLAWQLLEDKKELRLARKAALVLVLASIIISNIVFFNLFGDRAAYGGYGFIFWSNLLLLAATYVRLLPVALKQIGITHNGSIQPASGRPIEQLK